LANWIKKEEPTICCLKETHLFDRNKHWLRMKGWKKICQDNSHQKHEGVTLLSSDEVDFKLTLIKQDKEGHSKLKKGEIHKKEITSINLYAPNINAPNFIKHILKDLKTYRLQHSGSGVVLPIRSSYKQKINNEIL
jgi:exonuclease III